LASLRQFCKCIGLEGNISIIKNFFGYAFFGYRGSISVIKQITLLKGSRSNRINLNLIRVGIESFSLQNEREIDAALQIARSIFARVYLGIGSADRYFIPLVKAKGYDVISDDDEAINLTEDFSGPNNRAIDIFIVPIWSGTVLGLSSVGGPCNHHETGTALDILMNGIVIAMSAPPPTRIGDALPHERIGRALAHEIGHYLGLDHTTHPNNLMTQAKYATHARTSVGLTPEQASKIWSHCLVLEGC
jgi:hypothetical protein